MILASEAADASIWCEEGREGEADRVCRVSMIVSTYNLERLAPLAVRSALAQKYDDYEVVIVDDASTDSSWDRVIATVREFRGFRGVRVKCLRNATNLGIAGTFNRLMSESSGELCVWQCGDDVAHLDRVPKIVKCWDEAKMAHPDLVAAASDVNRVGELEARDFVGEDRAPEWTVYSAQEVFERPVPLLGATAAYAREQYDFFGPVDPAAQAEDSTMHLRTMLRGSFLVVHEPLLEYHCVGGNSTSYKKTSRDAVRKTVRQWHHTFLQAQRDLAKCRDSLPNDRSAVYEKLFAWMAHRYDVWLKMMSDSLWTRLAALGEFIGIVRQERAMRPLMNAVRKDRSAISWIVFVLPRWAVDGLCRLHCAIGNWKRTVLTKLGRG